MNGTFRYLAIFLAASIVFSACKKNDEDPNRDWVPGADWIDVRDGQSYGTVKIGDQVWMAENFSYLPDSGSWAYNNDALLVSTYGRLYYWETAIAICPDGWHLPLQEEWEELVIHLGGDEVAGGKLKEYGTAHWESPNGGAIDAVGFTALPGGYMWIEDRFQDLHEYAHFWSSGRSSPEYAYTLILGFFDSWANAYSTLYAKRAAASVRYIKD